ncbi:MAG: 16S rRNA (adenine(1518)-N(6)/adenine(1519)-N(6))-dimethyltransferase RsmA [Chlorobi bacterium]|nr:16S rRNA (adenine(1518)-N(6)/adenine(1519)-N(6))-dimethyltransferase RsmA [Chlorobiota bacterium]
MVRPKKHLGQHFLNDGNIARKIAGLVSKDQTRICELGPGTGILTRAILGRNDPFRLKAVEIDEESVAYLKENIEDDRLTILETDFLKTNLRDIYSSPFTLIGNFPYNISSQIFFKVLEAKDLISEVVCMIQKEVAERIKASHGNKTYGILSVLLQTWFDIHYEFTVNEQVFTPPPKVKSAVIKLTRNSRQSLPFNEKIYLNVIKTAFNQRRKTLRNALKSVLPAAAENIPFLDKRAEQLSVEDFIQLTGKIARTGK